MNRILVGALGAVLLVVYGIFWWYGQAAKRAPSAPTHLALETAATAEADELPGSDAGDAMGLGLPEANEQIREQKRYDRLDKNRDGSHQPYRNAQLPSQGFPQARCRYGNKLLTFDGWSVATDNRFKGADKNGDGWLSREEFATTKPRAAKKPASKCR